MALGDIRVTLGSATGQVVRVNSNPDQALTAAAPINLRNTRADYDAIDKLTDVDTTGRVDSSTLIYNATTDRYELKTVAEALPSLDGGTF